MSFGNIPANSNSTGTQNVAQNAPMSNFPNVNQTSANNDSAENAANSPTPTFQPKRKTPFKLILGGILFVLLLIGGAAGLYLTQMDQDVRQQASTGIYYTCFVVSGTSCISSSSTTPCSPNGPRYSTREACWAANCGAENQAPCEERDGTRTCNSGLVLNATGTLCQRPKKSNGTVCNSNSECSSDYCAVDSTSTSAPDVGGTKVCQVRSPQPVPSPSPTPGSGGPVTPPPAQCTALGQACGSERDLSDTCCGNGVCQGTHNNRRCEDAQRPIDEFCTGGGSCTGYYGFRCNSLHTSPSSSGQLVCEQNPSQIFTGANARSQALAHAQGCGQIDQVCVGGDKQGQLCGEFSIINNSCGGGGGTPPPTQPSPQPSPQSSPTPPPVLSCNSVCSTDAQCQAVDSRFSCVAVNDSNARRCRLTSNPTSNTCQPAVGPMCMSISMNNLSNPTAGTADPEIGDAITLTCGEVQGAVSYIFRVLQADGTITNLAATGRTSESFTIAQSGQHRAQCQICTGATADTCLPYEPFAME